MRNGIFSIGLKTKLFLQLNVDVKNTTNYFRKTLGQSPPLLKDCVDVFRTLTLVGKRSYTKFTASSDKKLREFGYKAFHRILVTNKELRLFKIKNYDTCFQFKNPDSLEHTFLKCPVNVQFYQEILSCFKTLNNTDINLSVDQISLHNYPPPAIGDDLRRRLDLFISY